jgi:hypothetical protein
VQEHAVQLAAAGPAITVGGAGPRDAEWVKRRRGTRTRSECQMRA